jgi:hypothetical protein
LALWVLVGTVPPVHAQPAGEQPAPAPSAEPAEPPSSEQPAAEPAPAPEPEPAAPPKAEPKAPSEPEPEAAAAAVEDDEPPPVSAETKAKARQHFLRGLSLLREQAWSPALAEFLRSRDLFPTRVATNNAGIALRRLERYDDAIDMYETLLRDFKVSEAEREASLKTIAELRELVGTIDVTGAEPGASIVISSEDRGQYPPIKPLRVPAGNHVVRVYKEGYEPFETRVDVAGGQTVTVQAKLERLRDSGRLRVIERTGKTVDVVVDNVVVGQTPWEGRLAVGPHTVTLRGEGKLGSQPTAAPVKSEELTQLTLLAEPLEAQLRVDPTPPGASVWINSVNVGRGVWLGRLKQGSHKIEIKAEGFLTAVRNVSLQPGVREMLDVELDRDEDAPMWRIPPKWTVDVGASFLAVPTFGGDVAGDCSGECERSVGIGTMALVHGSYELGSGLGFGLELGYMLAGQDVTARQAELMPNGLATPSAGVLDHELRLQGFMAGATIGYHMGEQFPIVFRLGAGVLLGEFRDERSGSFTARDGSAFSPEPAVAFPSATFVYLDPGIRAGIRFAEKFELTAGVQALMLIAVSPPKWDGSIEVSAGTDGLGTYPDEELTGTFVAGIAPGLNLRYEF